MAKALTEFTRSANRRDGLDVRCRSCKSAYRRAYWLKNRARELEDIAVYYRAHAEQLRSRRRERHRADPSRDAAYAAARYRENPEKYKRLSVEYRKLKKPWRAWRKKNPLKSMALVRNYQMRKRGALVEKISYDAIFARDKGLCHICGTSVTVQNVHFDHVVPLARGGLHAESNVKVSHAHCNVAKGARLLSEMGGRARVILRERGLG